MEVEKLSYEEAYKEMENILAQLESEELTLEESIEKFKIASDLHKHCGDLLEGAEGRISAIVDGVEKDFSREG